MATDRPRPSPIEPMHDADRLLGGCWEQLVDGREPARVLLASALEVAKQSDVELEKLRLSASRLTVPTSEIDRWLPVELALTDRRTTAPVEYGDGETYGDGTSYGQQAPASVFSWPWPHAASPPAVVESVVDAGVVLVDGTDFRISGGRIHFTADPFADSRLVPFPVQAADGSLDSAIRLFGYRGVRDSDLPYRQFGYAFEVGGGLPGPVSRDLINAVYDAATLGSSRQSLLSLLAAASGTRLAESAETVRLVVDEGSHAAVVTDTRCYFVSTADGIAPGDALKAGQPVTRSYAVEEIAGGRTPTTDDFPGLAVSPGHLGFASSGDLVFQNLMLPAAVVQRLGSAAWEFPLGGFPGDVEEFWEETQQRGLAAGKTLAQWLDTRVAGNGPPTAMWLPATVNPLKFLVENILRYNGLLVRIRPDLFLRPAAGEAGLAILPSILPPNVLAFFYTEMSEPDSLSLSADFGYLEDSEFFDMADEDDSFSAGPLFSVEREIIATGHC